MASLALLLLADSTTQTLPLSLPLDLPRFKGLPHFICLNETEAL